MMRYPRGYNRVSMASRIKPIILIVLVLVIIMFVMMSRAANGMGGNSRSVA